MDLFINKMNTKPISKTVKIHGSKNSSVALIPAALLSSEVVTLKNIPRIKDTEVLVSIIRKGGHNISFQNHSIIISKTSNPTLTLPNEVSLLRASSYFIGVYLALYGQITIPMCGGCNFGDRPLDYHINAFKKMGVEVSKKENFFYFNALNLHPEKIYLPFPSLGATLNIIFLATKIKGTTQIYNFAKDPEVYDVINFLRKMGASIKVKKSSIIINGGKPLKGTIYEVIPDRIEACTYLSIVACNLLPYIKLTNVNLRHIKAYLKLLSNLKYKIIKGKNYVIVKKRKKQINKEFDINITTYPSIPTDLQPIITTIFLCNKIKGTITDTIYPNRFSHIDELIKIGAIIHKENNKIFINPSTLTKGNLVAHDLRCSAALILAALYCNDKIIIHNIDYLFRGYETFLKDLKQMGFNISLYKEISSTKLNNY